jgi:hypothetical protein
MDGAARLTQEMALGVARHSQAQQVPGAVHVAALEGCRGHAEEHSHAGKVLFGDIDKAFLAATIGAAGLAIEP